MRTKTSARIDAISAKRILLVVDACHLGETLRIVPYVAVVRERYPEAHITLLTNEDALATFAHVEIFDRVVLSRLFYNRPASRFGMRFSQAHEWLRLVRQLGICYDMVITYYWGGPLLHLLGYIVGRPHRIGYSERSTTWFSRLLLSSHLGPFNWNGDQPQQHIALLRAAGIETEKIAAPSMRYTHDDTSQIAQILQEHGLASSTRLVVLHPGADWACQQWLQDRWAELADELAIRYNADIVFTGTSSEADLIAGIQRRMKLASVSLVGQTTLAEVTALLARCYLCVCVDSAPFELTQAVNIPAVVLAGPTRPETVIPGRCLPTVVNRTGAQLADAIVNCKSSQVKNKGWYSGCLNYECPVAGLRDITVPDVLVAVERQVQAAGLRRCTNVTGSFLDASHALPRAEL